MKFRSNQTTNSMSHLNVLRWRLWYLLLHPSLGVRNDLLRNHPGGCILPAETKNLLRYSHLRDDMSWIMRDKKYFVFVKFNERKITQLQKTLLIRNTDELVQKFENKYPLVEISLIKYLILRFKKYIRWRSCLYLYLHLMVSLKISVVLWTFRSPKLNNKLLIPKY